MTVKQGLVAALQAATKPMPPLSHFDDALYKYLIQIPLSCREDHASQGKNLS